MKSDIQSKNKRDVITTSVNASNTQRMSSDANRTPLGYINENDILSQMISKMNEVNPTLDEADSQATHLNFKKSSVLPGLMDKRNKRNQKSTQSRYSQ